MFARFLSLAIFFRLIGWVEGSLVQTDVMP